LLKAVAYLQEDHSHLPKMTGTSRPHWYKPTLSDEDRNTIINERRLLQETAIILVKVCGLSHRQAAAKTGVSKTRIGNLLNTGVTTFKVKESLNGR
jgi:DNA-directed RNA polymerase specialized sigma24 family protein